MRFKALTFFAFLFVLLGVSLMSVVSAQTGAGSCSQTMASKNTNDFFNEIPTLNTNLGNCPITLPSSVNSLLGSGNVLVSVQMTDGSVKEFYLTLANSQITSITSGATTKFGYKIKQGDMIKFGRVRFRVKKINSESVIEQTIENSFRYYE